MGDHHATAPALLGHAAHQITGTQPIAAHVLGIDTSDRRQVTRIQQLGGRHPLPASQPEDAAHLNGTRWSHWRRRALIVAIAALRPGRRMGIHRGAITRWATATGITVVRRATPPLIAQVAPGGQWPTALGLLGVRSRRGRWAAISRRTHIACITLIGIAAPTLLIAIRRVSIRSPATGWPLRLLRAIAVAAAVRPLLALLTLLALLSLPIGRIRLVGILWALRPVRRGMLLMLLAAR